MKEIWKTIEGYEKYEISNLGRVKSLKYRNTKNAKILKNVLTKGYNKITFYKGDNKWKAEFIHRLVAKTFIPNPDNKPFVNHINSITTDNRAENLEWVTQSENIIHGYQFGNIKTPNTKKIKCSNGMIFESSGEAARWLNSNIYKGTKRIDSMSKNIRRATTGHKKYKIYGFEWKDII